MESGDTTTTLPLVVRIQGRKATEGTFLPPFFASVQRALSMTTRNRTKYKQIRESKSLARSVSRSPIIKLSASIFKNHSFLKNMLCPTLWGNKQQVIRCFSGPGSRPLSTSKHVVLFVQVISFPPSSTGRRTRTYVPHLEFFLLRQTNDGASSSSSARYLHGKKERERKEKNPLATPPYFFFFREKRKGGKRNNASRKRKGKKKKRIPSFVHRRRRRGKRVLEGGRGGPS